jgi:hypothetical protein
MNLRFAWRKQAIALAAILPFTTHPTSAAELPKDGPIPYARPSLYYGACLPDDEMEHALEQEQYVPLLSYSEPSYKPRGMTETTYYLLATSDKKWINISDSSDEDKQCVYDLGDEVQYVRNQPFNIEVRAEKSPEAIEQELCDTKVQYNTPPHILKNMTFRAKSDLGSMLYIYVGNPVPIMQHAYSNKENCPVGQKPLDNFRLQLFQLHRVFEIPAAAQKKQEDTATHPKPDLFHQETNGFFPAPI